MERHPVYVMKPPTARTGFDPARPGPPHPAGSAPQDPSGRGRSSFPPTSASQPGGACLPVSKAAAAAATPFPLAGLDVVPVPAPAAVPGG